MLYVHKSFVEGLFAGCKVISIVITLAEVMGPSHNINVENVYGTCTCILTPGLGITWCLSDTLY